MVKDSIDMTFFLRAAVDEWSVIGAGVTRVLRFALQISACLYVRKDFLLAGALSHPGGIIRMDIRREEMLTRCVLYKSVGPNLQIVHG